MLELFAKFIEEVDSYSLFWDEINLIDSNCWVLEPLKPTKTDSHRRIYLTNSVSIRINVDPRNPREIPEIIFLGSEAGLYIKF